MNIYRNIILFVILAYHVDNNRDVFHKDIQEGINTIAIGACGTGDKPLVVVGGNRMYWGKIKPV